MVPAWLGVHGTIPKSHRAPCPRTEARPRGLPLRLQLRRAPAASVRSLTRPAGVWLCLFRGDSPLSHSNSQPGYVGLFLLLLLLLFCKHCQTRPRSDVFGLCLEGGGYICHRQRIGVSREAEEGAAQAAFSAFPASYDFRTLSEDIIYFGFPTVWRSVWCSLLRRLAATIESAQKGTIQ